MHDPANKQELFPFLSNKLANADCPHDEEIVVTSGVTSIVRGAIRYMTQCDHEEADTRMLIHLLEALRNGSTNCLVHTVDTDVFVILFGKFHHLVSFCQDVNVWVTFGFGKNYTHYHIYEDLDWEKCLSLPVLLLHRL